MARVVRQADARARRDSWRRFLHRFEERQCAALLDDCLKAGISVVAIAYRYSTDAIAPAPLLDGAPAVQFIRSNAKAWNIDKSRFVATGGSAGGAMSLWLCCTMTWPIRPAPTRSLASRLAGQRDRGSTANQRTTRGRSSSSSLRFDVTYPAFGRLVGWRGAGSSEPVARVVQGVRGIVGHHPRERGTIHLCSSFATAT